MQHYCKHVVVRRVGTCDLCRIVLYYIYRTMVLLMKKEAGVWQICEIPFGG